MLGHSIDGRYFYDHFRSLCDFRRNFSFIAEWRINFILLQKCSIVYNFCFSFVIKLNDFPINYTFGPKFHPAESICMYVSQPVSFALALFQLQIWLQLFIVLCLVAFCKCNCIGGRSIPELRYSTDFHKFKYYMVICHSFSHSIMDWMQPTRCYCCCKHTTHLTLTQLCGIMGILIINDRPTDGRTNSNKTNCA